MARKVQSATPLLQLFQPGLHIAAKFHHAQIRAAAEKLRASAQAGCPHHLPGRKIGQSLHMMRHKGIARILARQIAVQHQPIRLQRGHVLHGMHGNIYAAQQHRIFNFLGEQALVANLLQGAIGIYQSAVIACGLDDHNLEGRFWQAMCGHQPRAGLECLRQRQRGTARANFQGLGGGRKLCAHGTGLAILRAAHKRNV
jgi:hypothetical protein